MLNIFKTFTSLSSIVGPISAVESLGEDDNEDDCHDDKNYDIDIADGKMDKKMKFFPL